MENKGTYAGKIGNAGIGTVSAPFPASGGDKGSKVKKGTDLRSGK